MLGTATTIVGFVSLIVSLLFLGMQTRSMTKQVGMAVTLNGTNGLDQCLNNLRDVYFKMMDYPGLRKHFYEGVACPSEDVERERVLLMAEALADVMETGLMATRRIPGTESFDDWRDYCRFILEHSPVTRDLLDEHPVWWPDLRQLYTS